MKEYQAIPVEAAKRIALEFDKQQVVIIAADTVHDKLHTATYGVSARDKVIAARIGEILTEQAGGVIEQAEFTEDFRRDFDAAKYKQALELLRAAECVMSAHAVGLKTQAVIQNFLKAPSTTLAEPEFISAPVIVCLCGSTRFMDAFQRANLSETLAGKIVLSIGCNTKSDGDLIALGEITPAVKASLDELHKRKIELADEILVLNVGGYIGDSTCSEIAHAQKLGKGIRYLEDRE